jgi:putative FmdB family regulatory protein
VPVYEFACNACGQPISVFLRSMNSPVHAACPRCGSSDLRRLISRFAVLRGSSGTPDLDSIDGMMGGLDESDPRAMAAWARRLQHESGEDMGPEFDEMVSRMERGESVDDDDFHLGDDLHDNGDDFL